MYVTLILNEVAVVASDTKRLVMKEVNGYESPLIEIIEVEVEKGFAVSGDGTNDSMNPGVGA